MEFLGLTATQLATIFAVAGGAIVVLYILKLRRRRVAVPFSKLWERVLIDRPTSSLFSQLKRLLSLLVQLALLALLVFALADPRLRAPSHNGRSLVVLLDGSASMKATDLADGGRTRAARDVARRLIREMGSGDRMLLAQMDAEITALSPMTDDVGPLEQALKDYEPRDTGVDFARALRFAQDALRDERNPEVIVVGDGSYPPARDSSGEVRLGDVPLRYVKVGRSGRNVGITAFAVRRYPLDKSRYEVLIELRNFSPQHEDVELTLSADGAPIDVSRVSLDPGGTSQKTLPDMSGANERLEAHITLADGSHDDLPADDTAYAALPARRRSRILAVTPGNRYLEAALLLDEYMDVTEVTPAEAPARLAHERYDMVILDGVAPPLPPGVNAFYIAPPAGPDAPLEVLPGPPIARPFFDHIDSHHPLMRWMSDLEDTNIGQAERVRLGPDDKQVAWSEQGPLIVAGPRPGGGRYVAMTFDVNASDLPLRISWPVLLINAVDWFSGDDPSYISSFRTGDTWRIPVPAGVESADLETPTGRHLALPVIEGRAVVFGTQAGFYRLVAGGDRQLVAANLADPDESNCAPKDRLEVNGTVASAPAPGRVGVRREIWIYLLAAALGIILVEWVTYHRRVTV